MKRLEERQAERRDQKRREQIDKSGQRKSGGTIGGHCISGRIPVVFALHFFLDESVVCFSIFLGTLTATANAAVHNSKARLFE